MTFASDATTIRSHFATEWPLLRPTVPVAYDNSAFDPAVDALDSTGNPAPWVRVTVLPGESNQVSLGEPTKVYRNPGVVVVQVFVPVGQGDGLAGELADDAASVFRGKRVNFVVFRTPSKTRVGSDGAWYQVNVSTPYQADITA